MSDSAIEDDLGFVPAPGTERLWLIELAFWRPSTLTDDEMEALFRDRDGRWSQQTKRAMLNHGAKGLDLNQNWALVPRGWSCPVCRRSKLDIFRLSSRGILLANLEEHHDHLRDYVGRRGRALFGDHWAVDLPLGCAEISDTLEHLVSSFSTELLCSECNAADGKAKLLLKGVIPPYFSFSPAEIRTFIVPQANADHRIDQDKVKATWRAGEASLTARVALIDQMLHMIHSGALHRERVTSGSRVLLNQLDQQHQLYQAFRQESDHDQRGRELMLMTTEFLARSVQKDSPVLAPRAKAAASPATAPSAAEFASYHDVVSPRRWRETDNVWSCPICERTKRDVVRRSGNRKWTGGIRDLIEPLEEQDAVAVEHRRRALPGFPHAFVIKGSRSCRICSDCADITHQLKSRRRDLTDVYLSADDLRSCLMAATPNAPHDVDWEEAARRAKANTIIGPAWDAFWKHRALASRLGNTFRIYTRCLGKQRGLEAAVDELISISQIDDQAEATRLMHWLLQENIRLCEEDENARTERRGEKPAQDS
ncbi:MULTISPECIES: hypothetical protein [Bradyrhizobium]|uniref:hypothetical protein n=1 Tax=Bradyrhizobium TaxID=374 RepID=UPI000456A173|nr:hypothetical protein [Bradyrhizobium japonicum]AHY49223.1 hypothetical protein BJS_07070 [Bradyrhizobium japonicum SEMIA 5079]MBR0731582.1 hypothetical protein [Bradyrhizobium japonicum]MCD9112607.1 hypothetical protein [Bradyrhizobium japonicum]MCD9256958.1 hypothetical protein [Bradyrhizobium japonicum SEMIA 5079]MCD9822216.1 hypothetical protein [Bradyrhizobium japonicum]